MIGWLYRLIVGSFTHCRHEWETLGKEITDESYKKEIAVMLRCKKCGDVNVKKYKYGNP